MILATHSKTPLQIAAGENIARFAQIRYHKEMTCAVDAVANTYLEIVNRSVRATVHLKL